MTEKKINPTQNVTIGNRWVPNFGRSCQVVWNATTGKRFKMPGICGKALFYMSLNYSLFLYTTEVFWPSVFMCKTSFSSSIFLPPFICFSFVDCIFFYFAVPWFYEQIHTYTCSDRTGLLRVRCRILCVYRKSKQMPPFYVLATKHKFY